MNISGISIGMLVHYADQDPLTGETYTCSGTVSAIDEEYGNVTLNLTGGGSRTIAASQVYMGVGTRAHVTSQF